MKEDRRVYNYYSKKARAEMAKNITNLDGSSGGLVDEEAIKRKSSINAAEEQARWDLAFGKISNEKFQELKESGVFDD